jgi:peptide-methionine (S)-S-oxide reductase
MKKILVAIFAAASFACTVGSANNYEQVMPEPPAGAQTAVFAGGCFWGVEAVFEHVKGVVDVMVTFDPAKVSYSQLLSVFFAAAHDPTQLNRQGPDKGTQYRSAIFYTNQDQKKQAEAYIEAINKSNALPSPVVTEVSRLQGFYDAEPYHQNYMKKHPNEPYIVVNDRPKLEALKSKFPDLYVEK